MASAVCASSQILKGKSFCLHLEGYKYQDTLEQRLVEQGARVEKGLSRSVSYLVIDKSEPDSSEQKEWDGKTRKFYYCKSSSSSSEVDVVSEAQKLGVKVVLLEDLFQKLQKCYLLPRKREHHYKVAKLKPPFLKIEDYSGQYQPLVYEMESWPLPRKNCHSNSCPFESQKPHRTLKPSQVLSKSKRVAKRGRSSDKDVRRSPGFCDCCGQRYDDLDRHLKGRDHKKQLEVRLTALDTMVEESGYTLHMFLQRRKKLRRPKTHSEYRSEY